MSTYLAFRGHKLPISILLKKKSLWITLALLALTVALLVISIGAGELKIKPLDVLKTLLGIGSEQYELVILTFRLPRIVASMLIGASLAVSGAILQGIIRNPLASPDLLGVTSGASIAAVVFITLFQGLSIQWLPVAAFVGAGATTFGIYILAWKQGISPMRLVLIGVGIEAVLKALTTMVIVISPIQLTSKAMIWLTGTVYGTTWNNVWALLPWFLFILMALVYGRNVNIQQLGEDIATGVGSSIQRDRFILLLISTALAGSAVAIGGAIGFVGLLAPHIARKLVGSAFGEVLPAAALIGALMVILADLIGRTAFSPLDLPVGIFTAGIGAPYFIFLLYKNRNQ
jgi:iron complex transport system permease protein